MFRPEARTSLISDDTNLYRAISDMSKSSQLSSTLARSFSHGLRPAGAAPRCGARRPGPAFPGPTAGAQRAFTRTPARPYTTVEEAKSRYRSGPFSATAGLLFLVSGVGLILYFRHEKARMERKRIADATKGVGKPKVGGPFVLRDQHGVLWSSDRMKGRYSLVYFGFSHCPDICPDELDKMARMVDLVNASPLCTAPVVHVDADADTSRPRNAPTRALPPLLPIFITCDPARDTPAVLKEYLAEFHPDLVGLTGTWEEIKETCKKYRVYFSTPEGVQKGQDYLVDHSIYFYLMDPDGDFVEAIGREFSPQRAADVILGHVKDWIRG
ncbi:hypothetical protein K3495_g7535 [Podosphaera aphanis]|nr:hypothetical protein K3495_g7535 [Podosphaera aphanis]